MDQDALPKDVAQAISSFVDSAREALGDDAEALAATDLVGLRLAAESYARKRRRGESGRAR